MSVRRPWALPMVPLYRVGTALDRLLRQTGLRRTHKLTWPVISVGSLSAGGAGKTPIVIALATMLQERGWRVDVLSRGYARAGSGVQRVQLEGADAHEAAREFGDEPALIAQRTSVPVWVGANRFASGKVAELENTSGLHLLDDGFQHRRLARDFDIVLVTAEDLADTLLPAGNLREPLAALHRADAIIIREDEHEAIEAQVRELAGPNPPLWSVRRTLRFPQPLGVFSAGLRPLAFCAIARPEGFAALLQSSGCGIIDTVIFDDHHRYDANDVAQIVKTARDLNATGFITTEKDAVKLTPVFRALLENFGPVVVAVLDAEFVYKAPVMRTLEARLRSAEPHTPSHPTADKREALVP